MHLTLSENLAMNLTGLCLNGVFAHLTHLAHLSLLKAIWSYFYAIFTSVFLRKIVKKKYKKCYSARRADKKCYTTRRDISRKIFTEFFHFFRETINYDRLKLFWVNSIFNKNCTFVRKVHEIRSLAGAASFFQFDVKCEWWLGFW